MSDYLTKADVWHFAALFSEPLGLHVSKWVRELLSVEIISPGEGSGRKGKLVYVPREGGKYQDSGEIETTWFPEGQDCYERASQLVGQRVLFFQHNERVGDPDANDGRGYRCVRWVEPAESGWAPAVKVRDDFLPEGEIDSARDDYDDRQREQVEREQRVTAAQQEARHAVDPGTMADDARVAKAMTYLVQEMPGPELANVVKMATQAGWCEDLPSLQMFASGGLTEQQLGMLRRWIREAPQAVMESPF